MLRYRLVSALIVISSALIFVALDAYWPVAGCVGCWMVPLAAYMIYGSAIECTGMVRVGGMGPIAAPALIGCAAIMVAAVVPVYWPLSGSPYPDDCPLGQFGWPMVMAPLAMLGGFVWHMREYRTGAGYLVRSMLAGWVAVYFGSCFAFAVALRLIGEPSWGLYLLVGMIVVTKFADAGAYFVGRAWGRRKLCVEVSPGKTVEGLIGGFATSVAAAWIYFGWCAPRAFGPDRVHAHPLGIVLLGLLLTLAGVMGDLLESVVKREMGCKDSGRLLPGLGGLWDVTDSLLPAAVVGYLVVVAQWIQGPGQ